jgi:Alginate lyase
MRPPAIPFFLAAAFAAAAQGAAGSAAAGPPSPPEVPAVYSLDGPSLVSARERFLQGEPALAPAIAKLGADAKRALEFKPVSVMDKTRVPPSGDKHDYMSQAPYFWPDPAKPGGLPYIRHDGKHNPESDSGTDARVWASMAGNAETLALSYFFTHNGKFAEHSAELIRVWFLSPATRMKPNLEFAQFVPGVNNGRGTGILEMRHLAAICDSIALMAGSPAWTAEDDRAFRAWAAEYLAWLIQSKNGRDEAAAKNNHGSWYDVQAVHLALFLGQGDLAGKRLAAAMNRMDHQIEPDGSQPLELARTKSLGYSLFNIEALFAVATLGDHAGVDFWSHKAASGAGLHTALAYLAPYADPAKPWIKADIETGDRAELFPLLAQYLRHDDDPLFRELLAKFGGGQKEREARWRLLFFEAPAG